MNAVWKITLAATAIVISGQAAAQVTFYEHDGFRGRSFTTDRRVGDFGRYGFNDRASSVVVAGERWEVCEEVGFRGHCIILRPGNYASLGAVGLNNRISSARMVNRDERADDRALAPARAVAQITFYEHDDFVGRRLATDRSIEDFSRHNFNDMASSAVVVGEPWEICEDDGFRGRCVLLRPGKYASLDAMDLNDRISSARLVSPPPERAAGRPYAPAAVAEPDYSRRNEDRLYEVNVTSVRAVVGTPEQRCWIEREQVTQEHSGPNVPGAIAGALIGGILGHQVGGGSGKDLATVGGFVAGAAIGANAGRDGASPQAATRDVRRCDNVPSQAKPQYWDVTYNFQGQEHHVQMTQRPGQTLIVNERGEPRTR